MARVTVEDCTDLIPNRFKLVLLATQRTKELNAGAPSLFQEKKDKKDKKTVISLREIASGHLSSEKLEEELIATQQKQNKVDTVKSEDIHAEAREESGDIELSENELSQLGQHDFDSNTLFEDALTDDK